MARQVARPRPRHVPVLVPMQSQRQRGRHWSQRDDALPGAVPTRVKAKRDLIRGLCLAVVSRIPDVVRGTPAGLVAVASPPDQGLVYDGNSEHATPHFWTLTGIRFTALVH